ncbi:MAG: TonB family protein, partial [Gemmatimonadales bacterium]
AAAVYATTSGQVSNVVATVASRVTMIQTKPSAEPKSAPAAPKSKAKSQPVAAPKKVSAEIPVVDPNTTPTMEPETGPTSNLPAGGTSGAFNAFQVDVEVVAIAGSFGPRYPEGLRSAGTEGQVIAQFIVDEKGRADQKSFKVLTSTHPLFADAVRRALPQMRFHPAKIAGKPVSQLVQQQFQFKLDR